MVLPGVIRVRVVMERFSCGTELKRIFLAGFRRTTNNRMELMAVIAGLGALKKNGVWIKDLFRQSVCSQCSGKRLAEKLDCNRF